MASNLSYLAAPVTSTASSILTSFFCAFINIHDAFWWGVGTSPVSCTDLRSRPQLMNINEAGWWRTQSELRSNIRVFLFLILIIDVQRERPARRQTVTFTEDVNHSDWLIHTRGGEESECSCIEILFFFFGRLVFNFQRQTDKMTGADSTESQSVWDKTR